MNHWSDSIATPPPAPAPTPAFKLALSSNSATIASGATGTSTLTSVVSGGFSAAIGLSVAGMPSGMTATFSPTTIPMPGAGTSKLTVKTTSAVAAGTYALTVKGTGGGITQTASLAVTVLGPPNLAISLSTGSLTVKRGSTGTATVSVAPQGSFQSAVSLSVTGMPAGVTVKLTPSSFSAPGTGSSTLQITASTQAAVGNFTLQVKGTGGGITKSAPLALSVTIPPSFSLTANPASVSIVQGSSGTVNLSVNLAGGFNSPVTLTAAGAPAGLTVNLSRTSFAAPGSGTAALTFSPTPQVAAGTYPVTVTAAGGDLTASVRVSITVTTPISFNLSTTSTTLAVHRGGTVSTTVTLAFNGTVGSTIQLSITGLPAGVSGSFSKPSTKASAVSSALTLSASRTAALGSSTISVTATSAGISRTSTSSLQIR